MQEVAGAGVPVRVASVAGIMEADPRVHLPVPTLAPRPPRRRHLCWGQDCDLRRSNGASRRTGVWRAPLGLEHVELLLPDGDGRLVAVAEAFREPRRDHHRRRLGVVDELGHDVLVSANAV